MKIIKSNNILKKVVVIIKKLIRELCLFTLILILFIIIFYKNKENKVTEQRKIDRQLSKQESDNEGIIDIYIYRVPVW